MAHEQQNICAAPLPPVRGLIPIQNAHGKLYRTRDVHRWLRLNRLIFKTEKLDLLVAGPIPQHMPQLIEHGKGIAVEKSEQVHQPLDLRISLRTDCPESVPDHGAMRDSGLFDVFLCPDRLDQPSFLHWLDECRAENVSMRIQIRPPFATEWDMSDWANRLAAYAPLHVNLVLHDPFARTPSCSSSADSQTNVLQLNRFALELAKRNVEVNIYGLPLCHVFESLRNHAGGWKRFFRDHQQYSAESYELALRLYGKHPAVASLAIAAYLGRNASFTSLSDEAVLRWLIVHNRRRLHQTLLLFLKLLNGFGIGRGTPRELEAREIRYVAKIDERKARGNTVPACEPCSLRLVCDRKTREFTRILPGLDVATQSGELVSSPLAQLQSQRKQYDSIDEDRRTLSAAQVDLANVAREIVLDVDSAKKFGFDDVLPVDTFCMRMPGAYRYLSLLDRECATTLLHWGELPMTIAVTFGGGIADYVGFSIWRSIKIVCPMVGFSHRVVLHADAHGRYVLLRDGEIVQPVEFEGRFYVPRRLPSVVQISLSMWNVQGSLCTQNPMVWPKDILERDLEPRKAARISVIVISTRYARRLQAVLQGIAHQSGIELEHIEVIVGYVPGIDATDDLIKSVQLAHPRLRVVRSPFPEEKALAKGVMINQSVEMASGEWIVILDADIVLAPDLLAKLLALDATHKFAAPIGRKMLDAQTTAAVLLGETSPWSYWDALLEGPGEGRYGEQREGGRYPVGFCQCVRRECFDSVKYKEYDHFEGADWEFARDMVERFGECTWLDVPVLHLDHGGSQWFGSRAQL